MKKIFLTLVLFFGISVSSSIHAYADEIATDESVSETISNESLSDEVIDSLTIENLSNHILRKQHKCILLLVWLQKGQMHYIKTGCIMETEMLLDILIGMLRWQRC